MTTISITLPDTMARRLTSTAKKRHVSRSAMVREFLRDSMKPPTFESVRARIASENGGKMPYTEEEALKLGMS